MEPVEKLATAGRSCSIPLGFEGEMTSSTLHQEFTDQPLPTSMIFTLQLPSVPAGMSTPKHLDGTRLAKDVFSHHLDIYSSLSSLIEAGNCVNNAVNACIAACIFYFVSSGDKVASQRTFICFQFRRCSRREGSHHFLPQSCCPHHHSPHTGFWVRPLP